jgi:hypothetical protein
MKIIKLYFKYHSQKRRYKRARKFFIKTDPRCDFIRNGMGMCFYFDKYHSMQLTRENFPEVFELAEKLKIATDTSKYWFDFNSNRVIFLDQVIKQMTFKQYYKRNK